MTIGNCLRYFFNLDISAHRYVYGGGRQTRTIVDLMNLQAFAGKKLDGIVVRNRENMFPMMPNVQVFAPSDLSAEERRKGHILIAVNEIHNKEIKEFLQKCGWKNIYYSENWEGDNPELRSKILEEYMEYHDMKIQGGIIRYQRDDMDFRMAVNNSEGYMSMVLSGWNDIVMPALFGEEQIVLEGPYEYGNVRMESGDTVFDLGANIGMFSCVAAAKHCNVYAFEPTGWICSFLTENSKLNPNIYPMKMAVGDVSGTVRFFIDSTDTNTGMNSLLSEEQGIYGKGVLRGTDKSSIEVSCIRLDDFVMSNNIPRVDFIKADIEGAERQMLKGAEMILRKYAPKLSLCTYHLPDDPRVLEKLILEANPRYVVTHRWKKLFAYVP